MLSVLTVLRRGVSRGRWLVLALVALLAAPLTMPAARAVVDVGNVNPATGFPFWYEDNAGLSTELCLDPAFCSAAAPNPNAAPAVPGNFPDGGAFYWQGIARTANAAGGSIEVRMMLHGAFAVPVATPGEQIVFTRERFRADRLAPNTRYTVTYPFGARDFVTDASGRFDVTEQQGCLGAPCDFTSVFAGPVTSFLRWDPAVAPAAPAGFLGDAVTPHAVVGSPNGQNFLELRGLNAGGPGVGTLRTTEFTIEGKIATGPFLAPQAPLNVTAVSGPGAGEATVSWVKPVRDGGSPVTGYNVYAGPTAASVALIGTITDAATTSLVDSGLAEGEVRHYQVTAVNAIGEGLRSADVTANAFVRPGAPTQLSAVPGSGIGDIALSWTAPSANGGTPITGYDIWRAEGSGPLVLVTTTASPATSYTDSGRLPLTSYHYQVRARNAVGAGAPSNTTCGRAFPWHAALDSLSAC